MAIEFVCCQQSSLFYGQPSVAVSLSDISRGASDVGPSASQVGKGTDVTRTPPSERERQYQSERDKLKRELKRKVSFGGDGSSTTYGGKDGRTGGGDSRSRDICKHFNGERGCFAKNCQNKHVCNKTDRNGRPCERDHSACRH